MLVYYKFRSKSLNKSNTLNIIHKNINLKRFFSLFGQKEGVFFMNNEKNKKVWLKKCEETLRMGGRSEVTIKNYRYAIIRFLNRYDEKTNISKLTTDDIIKYFKKDFIDKGLSAATYNVNLAAVRFFYLICFERSISKVLLPNSKLRKRFPKIVTKELFLKIINNEDNLEHKCWLLLSFCCGLRISEVATIKIEDIYSKEHKLRVLGKGNKERFTILPDIVIKFLRLFYQKKRYTHKKGYLFIGQNVNNHICERTIGNYFSSLKKEYNLPPEITEHSLRHSFATYFLMNGGDLLVLKSMMGHKSLNSTSIYVHLSQNFNNIKGIKHDK